MFIDANIFIYANFDQGKKGTSAKNILLRVEQGERAWTSSLVIDEVMWTTRKERKHLLRQTIEDIYQLPNLTILPLDSNAPIRALSLMEEHNLRPHDALHAAVMQQHKIKTIASDDSDFDRVPGLKRIKL